ncbi:MAG: class I SAM-dependent rRNA methyltransferase [Zavarzinella sp.]
MSTPQVILKTRKALPFFARHPWVFNGAIAKIDPTLNDGDTVDLISAESVWIARGLYNSRSKITVRLYTWDQQEFLDRTWLRNRIQQAIAVRTQLGVRHPSRGCRLIFSEADQLSGLVVDEYANYCCVQVTSLALAMRLEEICDILEEILQPKGIFVRTEQGIRKLEGLELNDHLHRGELPPEGFGISENGIFFEVNLAEGQKTGFYHDQRDNRLRSRQFAVGKKVLDACCYTGGFGLNCLKAGASQVDFLDTSQLALDIAARNAQHNSLPNASFWKGDVLKILPQWVAEGRKYDLIVLDPPKFARDQATFREALKGYHKLHQAALQLLVENGTLITCSCSGLLDMEQFLRIIQEAASQQRRHVQIIEKRGAALDHPIALSCPETEYLKCVICRVG